MPALSSLPPAATVQVAGLVAAPIGIGIQIASGVDSFPLIPPGAVLLLVGAMVIALVPWRWTPVIGVLVAGWIGVGGVLTPEAGDRLAAPGDIGPFAGITVQVLGILVAVVAGVVAAVQVARARQKVAAQR